MTDLPGRQELAERVRHYRIEGYELEDKIQEAYLCILDPDSDHNVERHMKRLQNRCNDRRRVVIKRLEREHTAGNEDDWLYGDNAAARTDTDLDALTVLIAARSECETAKDSETLELLVAGASYNDLCRDWKCWRGEAKMRVSRFRKRIQLKVYGEEAFF